jgi:ATP-binding cassette subfamily F protein uup
MDQVANEIWAFARGSTEIQRFADYLQWESWYSEQDFDKVASNKNSNSDSGADDSGKGGSKRKMTFKEKLEFEGMEAQIAKYEADLATLQAECEDPKTATNAERLTDIYSQIGDITSAMEQAYIRWSELEKKK